MLFPTQSPVYTKFPINIICCNMLQIVCSLYWIVSTILLKTTSLIFPALPQLTPETDPRQDKGDNSQKHSLKISKISKISPLNFKNIPSKFQNFQKYIFKILKIFSYNFLFICLSLLILIFKNNYK